MDREALDLLYEAHPQGTSVTIPSTRLKASIEKLTIC